MKRKWIIPFIILDLALVVFGVYYFLLKDDEVKPVIVAEQPAAAPAPTPTNEMPNLIVTTSQDERINIHELTGKVMLIFFNPDCDHCQEEANMMADNKGLFAPYQIYFVTSYEPATADQFAVDYRLTDINYHFGHSAVNDVYNNVGVLQQVPTIYLYKNQKLVKKFEGITPLQELRKFM